ncbi:MAG: lamin tail domain-containing protein, partial [Planctomycetaceae bacterium]
MDQHVTSTSRASALAVILALCLLLPAGLAPRRADATFTLTHHHASLALPPSTVLITAVYYDTYLTGEPDEAFRLSNLTSLPIDLLDWTVSDGEGTITLAGELPPGAQLWIAKEADDFALEFGFAPTYEYGADTTTVPNLTTTGSFALANTGDQLILRDGSGAIVDSVVYADGDPAGTGWSGPGIYPYGGDTVGLERFAEGEREV